MDVGVAVNEEPNCSNCKRILPAEHSDTSNNEEHKIARIESSDDGKTPDEANTRDNRFWELMRLCAQQMVKVYSYVDRHQHFCVVGDVLFRSKAKTNLKKPSDGGNNGYYDVGSVIQLCCSAKSLTYQMYLKRLARPKFSHQVAIAEPIFQQLMPYLLGKTKRRPNAIDPNGYVPMLKMLPPGSDRRIQPNPSPSLSALNHQMTIGGIEGEFFENPCYMEFLMDWLRHTGLECAKSTSTLRLTLEQKVTLSTAEENCHHVFMKINELPVTHFFGSGFGLEQKKAFWAASRGIVRRLYHTGLITPVLYHTIGKSARPEFLGRNKRFRRVKEWKAVRNALEAFKNEMTARMPHWVQLTKDGVDAGSLLKATDDALCAIQSITQMQESKLNGLIRRKRKAEDMREADMIETKKNMHFIECNEDNGEERMNERNENALSGLNMPSTSTTSSADSEVCYSNTATNSKNDVTVAGNTPNAVMERTKTLIKSKVETTDDNCVVLETVKEKTVFTLASRSAAGTDSVHDNLAYYEGVEDDVTGFDEEQVLPPVNVHGAGASSILISPPSLPSNLEPQYQALCASLGVICVEEALSVRNMIRKKREAFSNEFKSFDEHIWKHFQINGQDDRTFSWKMTVRQKLLSLVRQVYKDSNLIAVGSTVNGCGSYNSDMDLCLCQPYSNYSFDTTRSYSLHVLKKLHRKFLTDWREVIRTCHYIPAKVPIIKLEMAAPYEELEIDINCNNVAGIYNSHLLHYYARYGVERKIDRVISFWQQFVGHPGIPSAHSCLGHPVVAFHGVKLTASMIDDRFPALCLLVKHWAINAGINNPMTGTLNSYSLILMVLHFLQCATMPPVLPNLQYLYPTVFNGTCSIESLELFRDLPCPLPPREINTETVGELLIAFFDYYSHFDFKNKAISINNGCVYSREVLAENTMRFKIFIEEPYDHQNTARCVTKIENLQQIKHAFVSARNAYLRANADAPNLECINVH